jgi:uncharacterized membrane protein
MNYAHLHLVLNHLPVVGIIIGILTLLVGFILKKEEVQLTALGIFVFSGITSIAAFYTGEEAEDVVENLAGISETLIHTHEEYAETFYSLSLILAGVSLLAFIAVLRKLKFAKYLVILTLLIGLAAGILAKYTATSGGEIRHPEIRSNANVIPLQNDDD